MPVNKKSVKDIMMKNRPSLATSTLKTYVSCLNNIALATKLDIENASDFETHFDKIMEYLMTLKPNIRKTKIASVIVLMDDKHTEHSKKLDEIIEKYRLQMFSDADEVDKQETNQKLSKKQEENFITWDEVLKIYKDLKAETTPLWKMEKLSPRQFSLLQSFVLLSCYVLIEPRRSKDYCEFKIRNYDDKHTDSKDNYMAVTTKKKPAFFIFNNYKNSKRLGTQKIEIPKELKDIILKWTEKNPNDFLLVNSKNGKMGQEKITVILNRIFKKEISSSMLRHIYLTHKFGNVNLKDLEETAKNMGNSQISRILKYVKKEDSDAGVSDSD